ncbi:rabphilin-3A isoform X2 [Coccinella septempunctata]|uniref:rabphilin-3A isoform X2 n=1 Tax=Coccinella septempunctata TaxID=41139 RepID=UPI001D0663FE|nr:rabphilin-3A isoform X2 [Coccinella septempunctata]
MDCGTPTSPSSRFVCPNDRQLALRAKLKTGWSIKTGSLGYQTPSTSNQPLLPEEQEAIVAVIKRAEELDQMEQERVGNLIQRLENMRRKVMGRNPSQCLLCADGFGILKSHKLVCMDCKKPVCHKCAINSCPFKHCPKEHWLCMICAEVRELWKKSGAWFFKSIPKYVLPNQNNGLNKTNTRSLRDDDSSSDEDWKIRKRNQRRHSSSESPNDAKEQRSSNPPSVSSQPNSASPCSSTHSKMPDFLKPYPNIAATFDSNSSNDAKTDGKAETLENAKRGLMCSRSLTDWPWSDSRSEGRVSPSTCSASSVNFKSTSEETREAKPVIDLSLGTMDLAFNYDPVNSTFQVTVFRAKNLTPMDMNGLADPYCKLNILPSTKKDTRLRTRTIHKTRNPEFNENLTFYDISEDDLMKKSLHIIVVDEDKYGHDFMGETRINLAKLKVQNNIYLTIALENNNFQQRGPLPGPELSQWFDDMWSRGQILLSLCYSTRRRSLLVTVIECANLLPMDNNGFSDPFVKLQLRPDPHRKKHKTTVKWKELNPVWNEQFAFETRPTELCTQSLYITVYDKDYGKSNDYLGGLVLGGLGSKGQRLKHWLDMIKYPDHHHKCWHNLSEENVK